MTALKQIIDQRLLLERFEGKGGWTYVQIPPLPVSKREKAGWRKLKGSIDDYELECSLMPMGGDRWFVPVKAAIRTAIKKEAGDYVRLILYAEVYELHSPEEFLLCLEYEPDAQENYDALPEAEKLRYLDWIFEVKDEETQVQRMADAIDRLIMGQRLYRPRRGTAVGANG